MQLVQRTPSFVFQLLLPAKTDSSTPTSAALSVTLTTAVPSARMSAAAQFSDALCCAAQRGDCGRIAEMLSAWRNSSRGGYGTVPGFNLALRFAAANGHVGCVDSLLRVTSVHTRYIPELRSAAAQGHIDVVRVFLAARATPYTFNECSTPLELAAAHGHKDVVQLLIDVKATPIGVQGTGPACRAARYGQCGVLIQLAKAGAHFGTPRSCFTAAHAAAAADQVDALKTLADVKVDVAGVNRQRETPVYSAVRAEAHGAAEYLLLHVKADAHARFAYQHAPLCVAAGQKSGRMLRLLLRAKADVHQGSAGSCDMLWNMPLHEAALHGRAANVRLLLRAKACLNAVDSKYDTPCACARMRGHATLAALLRIKCTCSKCA